MALVSYVIKSAPHHLIRINPENRFSAQIVYNFACFYINSFKKFPGRCLYITHLSIRMHSRSRCSAKSVQSKYHTSYALVELSALQKPAAVIAVGSSVQRSDTVD